MGAKIAPKIDKLRYTEYMEQSKKLWFKRKRYGWGWTPVTWQGWLSVIVFVVLIAWNASRANDASFSNGDALLSIVPQTFFLLLALLGLTYWKGEKPRWSWGKSTEKTNNE